MTLTSSAQTTLLEGRYGNLTLRLVVQKNDLRLKRFVKISTRTATRSSPVATYFGECRYLSISTVYFSYPYYSSSTYVVNCINTMGWQIWKPSNYVFIYRLHTLNLIYTYWQNSTKSFLLIKLSNIYNRAQDLDSRFFFF